MSISFVDEKEAIAAVAVVIAGADGVGTLAERTSLFDQLGALGAFSSLDAEAVGTLVGSVTDKLWSNLEVTGSGALASNSVNSVFSSAAGVLSADLRQQTYDFAATLVSADEAVQTEASSLQSLRAAFEL